MGLISPGGQNLLDFLELRQVLLTYDGMLEGYTYRRIFHTNFKAGIGSQGAVGMTAIIPATSEGYDSLVYNAYFTFSDEENSGNPAGKYALAFMEAVYRLPESVDRFDNLLVEAAINAYNALEGHAEETQRPHRSPEAPTRVRGLKQSPRVLQLHVHRQRAELYHNGL